MKLLPISVEKSWEPRAHRSLANLPGELSPTPDRARPLCETIDSSRRRKLQRELAFSAARDCTSELLFIGREYLDAFPSSRDCDVPLLRIRCGTNRRIAEQDVIDRFTLRAVGGDCIATNKLPITRRQHSSILKSNFSGSADLADHYHLTIGERLATHRLRIDF